MTNQYLMCAPDFFEISYVINPWMTGNVALGQHDLACQQWQALAAMIGEVAQLEYITPVRGVPDMVFTANAGLVLGNTFVLSHFLNQERQAEEPHFSQWFVHHGYEVHALPAGMPFEGAGDALLDRQLPLLWMGHGHRTSVACAPLLAELLEIDVVPLRLVDARFYHLDTCFCPLEGGVLMYYPAAFDAASQARIAALVPAGQRIMVSAEDAHTFACNAINSGRTIILNQVSPELSRELEAHGYGVRQTALSEFMKAGGAAKCLTLKLNESHLAGFDVAG